MRILGIFGLLFVTSACVSPSAKFREAEVVNEQAEKRGFIKNPPEAIKKELKAKCELPYARKWELKFENETPLIQQDIGNGKSSYGPYHVICFSFKETGDKKIKIWTKHQGGGYSKAYYLLPHFYLFNQKSQPVKVTGTFILAQEAWTGDYTIEGSQRFEKGETYYLIIESDNRQPTKPWSQYANYGMGAAAVLFPISVYSSVTGTVKLEVTD